MANNYFYNQIVESKDRKRIGDFMSAVNNSEVFVRTIAIESIEEILDNNGICSYANEQIRGITTLLEKYVDKSYEVEKVFNKLKKK